MFGCGILLERSITLSEETQERRQSITKEICELKHKPLDKFCDDTEKKIDGLHSKINWAGALLVATLVAAIADLAIRQ